jgi:hypothetical protein
MLSSPTAARLPRVWCCVNDGRERRAGLVGLGAKYMGWTKGAKRGGGGGGSIVVCRGFLVNWRYNPKKRDDFGTTCAHV